MNGRLAVLFLVGCAIFAGAQHVAAQKTPEEGDVIVSKDGARRLVGKIRSATPKQIQFAEKDKPPKFYSTDDYRIVQWDGVTNAADVLKLANAELQKIEDEFNAIRYGQREPPSSPDGYRKLRDAGLLILKRLLPRDRLADLPPIDDFGADDRAAINARPVLEAKYVNENFPRRLEQAGEEHRAIKYALGQASPLINRLETHNFKAVPDDIDKLDKDLAQRRALPVIQEFRNALRTLREAVDVAAASLPALSQNYDLLQLDEWRRELDAFHAAATKAARLAVLGPRVQKTFQELSEKIAERTRLCEDMTQVTRTLRQQEARLEQVIVAAGAAKRTDLPAYEKQLTELATTTATERKRLEEAPRTPANQYGLQQAQRLQKRISGSGVTLLASLESTVGQEEYDLVEKAQSLAQAQKAVEHFQGRLSRAQTYALRPDLPDALRAKYGTGGKPGKTLQELQLGLSRGQSKVLDFELQDLTTRLDGIAERSTPFFKPPTGDKRAARLAGLQQALESIQAVAETTEEKLAGVADAASRGRTLRQKLQLSEQQTEQAIKLLEIQQELVVLPEQPAGAAELDLVEQTTARCQVALAKVPTYEGLKELRRETELLLESRNRNMEKTRPAAMFEGLDATFADSAKKTSSALAATELADARVALLDLGDASAELLKLAAAHPVLSQHAEFRTRAEQRRQELDSLTQRTLSGIAERRRAAGWRPVLADESLLFPPGDQTDWLRVQLLIDQERFPEAQAALQAFADAHPAPEWRDDLRAVRVRLAFLRGRQSERDQDRPAALAAYREAVALDADSPLGSAAVASVRGLEAALQREEEEQRQGARTALATAAGAVVLLLACYWFWRESLSGRLRTADRLLQAARRAFDADHHAQGAALVRRAARLVAHLPEDHPQLARLRARLERTFADTAADGPRTALPAAAPAPAAADRVRQLLALNSPTAAAAGELVDWLQSEEGGGDAELRAAVIKCLSRQLKPEEGHSEADLHWRASLAGRCAAVLGGAAVWPALYQMRAAFWTGQYAAALNAARQVDVGRLKPARRDEVQLTIGRCLLEGGQVVPAIEVLQQVAHTAEQPAEARRWLGIAWARAATARGGVVRFRDLQRAAAAVFPAAADSRTSSDAAQLA